MTYEGKSIPTILLNEYWVAMHKAYKKAFHALMWSVSGMLGELFWTPWCFYTHKPIAIHILNMTALLAWSLSALLRWLDYRDLKHLLPRKPPHTAGTP